MYLHLPSVRRVFLFSLTVSLVSLYFSLTLNAWAAKQKAPRTLSIDSGYVPQLATYQSMNHLWLEFEGLGTAIFDGVGENFYLGKTFPTRALWVLVEYYLWPYANYTFFVANHEIGHGARVTATGGVPRYSWNGSTDGISIFPFIFKGFTRYGDGAFTTGTSVYFYPTDWTTVADAGGMNNSTHFAEALEDDVYYNTGHILQSRAYYTAKMDAYNYAKSTNGTTTGDVNNLLNIWSARGYSITTDDIKRGALISLLGNFTTLAYAWSIVRYIGMGDPNVNSLSAGSLKLPDLSFFENRYGISLRARSALHSGKIYIPFSIEYLYKGTPQLEISLGYRNVSGAVSGHKLASQIQGYMSSKLGVGVRGTKEFSLGRSSFFTLSGSVFHVNSLEGERTLGRLVSNTLGAEATGRYSYVF